MEADVLVPCARCTTTPFVVSWSNKCLPHIPQYMMHHPPVLKPLLRLTWRQPVDLAFHGIPPVSEATPERPWQEIIFEQLRGRDTVLEKLFASIDDKLVELSTHKAQTLAASGGGAEDVQKLAAVVAALPASLAAAADEKSKAKPMQL